MAGWGEEHGVLSPLPCWSPRMGLWQEEMLSIPPVLCCRGGGTQGHPGWWRAWAALFQFLLLTGISLQAAKW